jgi:hypothetical protein
MVTTELLLGLLYSASSFLVILAIVLIIGKIAHKLRFHD